MSEPSWQDLYDLGKAALQIRRPSMVVEEGDVSDAILCGLATTASRIVAYASHRFLTCFLDGAAGQDLTDLAEDRGVTRDPGAAAVGTVTFTRASFAAGGGTIPAGHRVAADPDENGDFSVFALDDDLVFGPTTLTASGSATCTKVGKAGNVNEDAINRSLDIIAFDPSITVTNVEHFVGGAEIESDEDLRDRVRGFFLTQARGTIDALEFGAKEVPGVARVTVAVDDSGVVTVYVADEEGNSNSDMADAVTEELEHWRDAADIVYVTGGVIYVQAITLRLTVRTGVDQATLLTKVRQAVKSMTYRLNPGETLVREKIAAAAMEVDRQKITKCEVIYPTADVEPAVNELIRSDEADISFG